MHHDPAAAIAAAVAAHAKALERHRPDDPASDARLELSFARANVIAEAIRAKALAMQWEPVGEGQGAVLDAYRLEALRGLLVDLSVTG